DHLGLERVVLVDEDLDLRRRRGAGAELGLQLAEEIGGQDQPAQDVAVLHLLLDLRPARNGHALDLGAEPPPRLLLAEPAGLAQAEARALGDLIEEGDARLLGTAGDREADQDREDDRVEDQEPGHQRRPTKQLQILEQKPAHQWPRSRKNRTKSLSGSGPAPFGRGPAARCSWVKLPSKIVSPSAKTTRRSP